MRTPATLLGVLSLLLTSSPSLAQSSDIERQDIAVDLSDPELLTITLDVELRATGPASFMSMALPIVPIVSVHVDGVPGTTAPHASYPNQIVNVIFPDPMTTGQQATVTVVLSGTASCVSGFCTRTEDETVFTFPQPGSAWYHSDLFGLDPFVGSLEILAPAAHQVVGVQGSAESVVPEGGLQRWTFALDEPTELVAFYAGVSESITREGVTATYREGEHNIEYVNRAVDVAAELLPIFAEQYGALPIDHAFIAAVPRHFAFGGTSILGTVMLNEVAYTTHDYLVEQGVAHEFAHAWWGNLASGNLPNEAAFLSEGMAEYAAWRAFGEARGDRARSSGMRMGATYYMYRRPDDIDMAILVGNRQSPAYVHATYHKGAHVYRALEQIVGADDFGEALKTFVSRGYGQLSVAALIEDVAAASGFDASLFFDQWLNAQGYPVIIATPSPEGLTLEVQGDYDLAVPLRITRADGSSETLVVSASGTSTHAIDGAAALVAVDPDWTFVREVRPADPRDINLDGDVDAADVIEVALRSGSYLPVERRVDGGYDPLYDIDDSGSVDDGDLAALLGQ